MKQVLCTVYEMFTLRFEKVMVRSFFLLCENYDRSPGQHIYRKHFNKQREVSLDS